MKAETTTCLSYHSETSYTRGQLGGHPLDWANQPDVFKSYPEDAPLSLPHEVRLPDVRLSSLLREKGGHAEPGAMDLNRLSAILRLSYSLTAKARQGGGTFYFRNVASAGALYPNELYVAATGVTGLNDGLYHYSIARHGLSLVRKGDVSNPVAASTKDSGPALSRVSFFVSAIFFRSAWKYRARSYRYHLLDAGHLLENLILALNVHGIDPQVSLDFEDDGVNRLLGLDEKREVCLAICTAPDSKGGHPEPRADLPELEDAVKSASRVSPREIDYPEVLGIHRAGVTVPSHRDAGPRMIEALGPVAGEWLGIDSPDQWPETMSYKEAVLTRRSRRNYVKRPISKDALSALLEGLCAGHPTDQHKDPSPWVSTGFLMGRAEGYDPGAYLLDPESRSMAWITSGSLMEEMARICLDQMWLANAAVHFVFMSNLAVVDRLLGARGYRYAMMEAGRWGERLYLMASALGLGCCGIGAFYDTEAARLLGLNDESRLLYLVAVGPVKGMTPQIS
ncbi:MAG: SagB/ThcOx family dehydrogenase [Deltaproteobacteria bacterium]|nr:SagB/ThcOx family dehydrogenase [Deltaproteobacteria bacterium]